MKDEDRVPPEDHYVAWLRWVPGEPNGEGNALELCGSDDPGAFRVYRRPFDRGLRDHVASKDCWCEPEQDAREPSVWIHKERH